MEIAQDPIRLRPMEISNLRTHSLLLYRPPFQPRRSSFGLGTTLETGLLPAFLKRGLRRRLINFPVDGPDRVYLSFPSTRGLRWRDSRRVLTGAFRPQDE